MDLKEAFAIPLSAFSEFLPKLNQTNRDDGKSYWHVVITTLEGSQLALYSSRTGDTIPLSPYSVSLP